MFSFSSLLQIIICQPSVRNWDWLKCSNVGNFLTEISGSEEEVVCFDFSVCLCRELRICVVVERARKQDCCLLNYNCIFSCHKAILSRVVWRSRKADNVHVIKHSLLGWIQDCEIWTGSLNVFWESRNNLSVKLIPMTINQFGMFSNSSRKQTNGKSRLFYVFLNKFVNGWCFVKADTFRAKNFRSSDQ